MNPAKAPWYFLGLQEMLVLLRSLDGRRRFAHAYFGRPHGHPLFGRHPLGKRLLHV